MKKITSYFLLVYLFGVQFVLYGLWRPEQLFVQMGIVNLVVFVLGGILALHLDQRINAEKVSVALTSFSDGISSLVQKYLFMGSVFALLVLSVVAFFVSIPCVISWVLVGVFIYTLIIARENIWHKTIHLGTRLFMPKDVLFWISVMAAVGFAHHIIGWNIRYVSTLSALFGLLFYYASVKLSHAIGSYGFMRLASAKLYVFVIVVGAVASLFAVRFAFVGDVFDTINTVVSDGISAAEGLFVSSDDKAVLDGDLVTHEEVISVSTGTVIDQTGMTTTGTVVPQNNTIVNFAEVLSHLMQTYGIALPSTKSIKFRYVSYTNPLYPVFLAAYQKKLIGSSTNPLSSVRCDVYQVMKGIVAGWKVSGKVSVMDQYWNYARDNGLLNGCAAKGDKVMSNNL